MYLKDFFNSKLWYLPRSGPTNKLIFYKIVGLFNKKRYLCHQLKSDILLLDIINYIVVKEVVFETKFKEYEYSREWQSKNKAENVDC